MFDRIFTDNVIKHVLTAPHTTTTGKVERLHETMQAEFFARADGTFARTPEFRAALDAWVSEYNTVRPHQSCGGRPPAERFSLAERGSAPKELAAEPVAGGLAVARRRGRAHPAKAPGAAGSPAQSRCAAKMFCVIDSA
jgi:hypothetical protein